MKRSILILLAAILIALMAAGCKTSPQSEPAETTETEAALTNGDEIVRAFFARNSNKFPESDDAYRTYYGGIYLDEDNRYIILLTDTSRMDEYEPVADNVGYQPCSYSYAELTDAMDRDTEKLRTLSADGDTTAADFHGMALNDKDNTVTVLCTDLNDEKIAWYKENISEEAFLRFQSADPPVDL